MRLVAFTFSIGLPGVLGVSGVPESQTVNCNFAQFVALGFCEMVIVAVGGGGAGVDGGSYGAGGGGSGYVDWKKENLTGTIELQEGK